MGYLYILIGLCFGLGKGFCGKKMSVYVRTPSHAMLANACRMLICTAVGLLLVCLAEGGSALAIPQSALWISALSGVSTAAFVVFWVLAVQRGAYMLTDVFCTSGLILPLLLGSMFLGEDVSTRQWIGFGVLVAAVLVMCSYSTKTVARLTPSGVFLLIMTGLWSGMSSFSQKLFVGQLPEESILVFNFYTYVFAAVLLGVCYPILRAGGRGDAAREKFPMRTALPYIATMAVCLFANSYFVTKAAQHLSAIQLYPLNTALALIGTLLMSTFCFGERINAKVLVGVALTFAALLAINLL